MVARAAGVKADTRRFYVEALSEAERAGLDEALEVEGFEEEIAALRLRLRSAIEERPQDVALMLRGMDVLRRMLAAKYGLTRGDQKDCSAYAEETLRRLRERAEGGSNDDE